MGEKIQEKEVYEYVFQELKKTVGRNLFSPEISAMVETINIIMRRYDLSGEPLAKSHDVGERHRLG